jgi:putative flippase GtrA
MSGRRYSAGVRRLRELYLAFRTLIHELAKFLSVGAAMAVLDIGVSNLLLVPIGPVPAKAVSTAVAATCSYFLNRHWTFAHRARTGLFREYWIFILLSVVALGIAEACVGIATYGLDQHSRLAYNLAANVFGLGLGTLFRYWSFKRWVFPPREPASTAEVLQAVVQ